MKRGGSLTRKTPLKRSAPLRARSKTKKYARRVRHKDYMAFIAKQPCDLSHTGQCEGRVQVDHAGDHGLGVRSPDHETIPLCKKHHGQRTDYRGFFKNWVGTQMREWRLTRVRYYQELYVTLVGLRQTPWRQTVAA